jgi:hypothetical protein
MALTAFPRDVCRLLAENRDLVFHAGRIGGAFPRIARRS